jgi:hypothetical protein
VILVPRAQAQLETGKTIWFVFISHCDSLISTDPDAHDEHNEDATQYHQLNEDMVLHPTSAATEHQRKDDIHTSILWTNDPLCH